jgi:hypothetical protein
VRRLKGRNGLDYVESADHHAPTLYVYFLGKLPPEFTAHSSGMTQCLRIEGGERITGIEVTGICPEINKDPERDDYLVVTLNRSGDSSPYTLRLVGVAGIDPRYDRVTFSFNTCCPSDIDCAPVADCCPPPRDEPKINYLAKDYQSFRQLMLDRLAVLMPAWTERHVPDLGMTLVEVLAYVGDQLSYYQDAVATEAYLGTAKQRISLRRHARLVDYLMHEGCNARAWVQMAVAETLTLSPSQLSQIAFITGLNTKQPVQTLAAVDRLPANSYEYYEIVAPQPARDLVLRPAHNRIAFYTWGRRECCLKLGATSATLLDQWLVDVAPETAHENLPPDLHYEDTPSPLDTAVAAVCAVPPQDENAHSKKAAALTPPVRALHIQVGDVLIFEEVLGAKTGNPADADPSRRWAVRVTKVELTEDPVYLCDVPRAKETRHVPTPLVNIEWAPQDALPFALCLSAIGRAPECTYITDISVARGNIVLVDHGRSTSAWLPPVPGEPSDSACDCEGEPRDVTLRAARYRPTLPQTPLVYRQPLPAALPPAATTLRQEPRQALPSLSLVDDSGNTWTARQDLIASSPDDRHFVAEIDNDGYPNLRFGDDELGRAPTVGERFAARYRSGGGTAGNVGAQAIAVLVLNDFDIDPRVQITVRNPLPAQGGSDPEALEAVRRLAPEAFRREIQRAITAADYATLAERNPQLQRASARLAWTGSWYEAAVAVDPLHQETADDALLHSVQKSLYRYRRIGHDLRVQAAVYVPLTLALDVCALPGYERGHVKAALLARFSNRLTAGGKPGFFHPDELSFGEAVLLSHILAAAMEVPGVECVRVSEFHRLFAPPNHEIDQGLLPLTAREIAQLDNDPNHPERGQLQITVRGGR